MTPSIVLCLSLHLSFPLYLYFSLSLYTFLFLGLLSTFTLPPAFGLCSLCDSSLCLFLYFLLSASLYISFPLIPFIFLTISIFFVSAFLHHSCSLPTPYFFISVSLPILLPFNFATIPSDLDGVSSFLSLYLSISLSLPSSLSFSFSLNFASFTVSLAYFRSSSSSRLFSQTPFPFLSGFLAPSFFPSTSHYTPFPLPPSMYAFCGVLGVLRKTVTWVLHALSTPWSHVSRALVHRVNNS